MNAHQIPQADDSDALSTVGDASTWLDEHGDVCTGTLARGSATGSWRKTWYRTPCWRHSSRVTDSRAARPFARGYSQSFGIRSLIIADVRQIRFRPPKPTRS